MRKIVVKWKQQSRKSDTHYTPQFRAVMCFEGTTKKLAAVEVCSIASLGEESWVKPEQQSRIPDEQILLRAIEALAAATLARTDILAGDDGAWLRVAGITMQIFDSGAPQLLVIDLGMVHS